MDRLERGFYRQAAELKFLKHRRQEFQAWFGEIMEKAHPADYENIRLTQGDGALDGILVSAGIVFQVYAPREQSTSEILKKIEVDFAEANTTMRARGAVMNGWVFVHNDEGLTKEIGPALVKLAQNNPGMRVERWTFERIWLELEGLTVDQLTDLFGPSPTEANVDRLQFPSIREVIDFLAKGDASIDPPTSAPNVDKLEFNKLSEAKADLLRVGRRRQQDVAAYLEGLTDPTAGEDIAEGFRVFYANLRDSGMTPDQIFTALWRYAGGEHFALPEQIAAVIAVLAYFFSTCDIFENVPDAE